MSELYQPQPVRMALIKALAKAPAPEAPKDIRDRDSKLILRHEKSGYLSIHVELSRGKRKFLCDARRIIDPTTKLTLGMVRNRAEQVRGQHVNGRDFSAELKAERAVPTLKTFLDDTYGPWAIENRRSGAATLERIRKTFPKFLRLKLNEITLGKVEPWRTARRRAGASNETINRDLGSLHACLNRAVRLKVLAENPLKGVEKAEVDRSKQVVRALTADEKARLIEALKERDDKKRAERASANAWREQRGYRALPAISTFCDELTPAVILSLETGARRSELFGLTWQNVNLDGRVVRLRGKTFQSREIPLSERAHTTLFDWWTQQGEPVKGRVFAVDNLKRSYAAVMEEAEIPKKDREGKRVNWHSLRHTFGTLLGAANVDATTLMKLMGHANLSTTQRYLHTDKERKRAAVELLGGKAQRRGRPRRRGGAPPA